MLTKEGADPTNVSRCQPYTDDSPRRSGRYTHTESLCETTSSSKMQKVRTADGLCASGSGLRRIRAGYRTLNKHSLAKGLGVRRRYGGRQRRALQDALINRLIDRENLRIAKFIILRLCLQVLAY